MSYLWRARARSLVVSAIGVGKFKMKRIMAKYFCLGNLVLNQCCRISQINKALNLWKL